MAAHVQELSRMIYFRTVLLFVLLVNVCHTGTTLEDGITTDVNDDREYKGQDPVLIVTSSEKHHLVVDNMPTKIRQDSKEITLEIQTRRKNRQTKKSKVKSRRAWMSLFENQQMLSGQSEHDIDNGGLVSGSTYHQCEPITVDMCGGMPWNMTHMPNLLHHSSQENAILASEPFQKLVATNCSNVLLFFLCALYIPICTPQFPLQTVPPCQSLCLQVQAGCEPILHQNNLTWPEGLDCAHLPRYHNDICLSPEAIVPSPPKREYKVIHLKCKP